MCLHELEGWKSSLGLCYRMFNGIWQNPLEGGDFHVAWYAFDFKIWHFRTKSLIQIFYSKSQSRASFWWFDRFQLFVVLKIWQNRTDFGSNLSNHQNDEPKWLTWRIYSWKNFLLRYYKEEWNICDHWLTRTPFILTLCPVRLFSSKNLLEFYFKLALIPNWILMRSIEDFFISFYIYTHIKYSYHKLNRLLFKVNSTGSEINFHQANHDSHELHERVMTTGINRISIIIITLES